MQSVVQKTIRLPNHVTCSLPLAAFATEYLAIEGSEWEPKNLGLMEEISHSVKGSICYVLRKTESKIMNSEENLLG